MAPTWQIRVKDQAGALAGIIDRYSRLAIKVVVNGAGAYALELSGDDPKVTLLELDGTVEFWRGDLVNGIDWRMEFAGLHRDSDDSIGEDGRALYVSSGRGYNDLLHTRIIDAYAGSAGAAKDGSAETVIKAFVEEQCGPTAGARAIAGLSVQADGGQGNTVRLSRAYRNVLEVCQELAAMGGGDFDVASTGPATYEFRWFDGQLGTDRSATVKFAVEWANMGSPTLRRRRSAEISAVLVGGQGDGVARTTVWREDAGRIGDSPINRRELFVDQRQEADADGLNFAGDRALWDGQATYELDFDVLQTPGCLYGLHYFLGDLVTVKYKGYTAVKKIVALAFTVEKETEKVAVVLADPPAELGT